jgi:enolase
MSIANLFDIQQQLEQLIQNRLKKDGLGVGDEGGFVVADAQPKTLLDLLAEVIEEFNFTLGMDVAASEFLVDSMYEFGSKSLSTSELADILGSYTREYPLEYI